MPSRSIASNRCRSIRLRMAIFCPFASVCGNFAATLLVSSLTCLSGRCGLSFSSACSPGNLFLPEVCFCACSESAPSQTAVAIQRAMSDVLMNRRYRIMILSLGLSYDFRIEDHPRGLAFARNCRDETFGVDFSDAMIGAVCNEDAAVFGDGDLLRRVQLPGKSFFAVAAEARAACSGNACDHASANNADAIVAAV